MSSWCPQAWGRSTMTRCCSDWDIRPHASVFNSLSYWGGSQRSLRLSFFRIWFYYCDHSSLSPASVPTAAYRITIFIVLFADQANTNEYSMYKRKHTVYSVPHQVLLFFFHLTVYHGDHSMSVYKSSPHSFSQLCCVAMS